MQTHHTSCDELFVLRMYNHRKILLSGVLSDHTPSSQVCADRETALTKSLELAELVASKSPVAVQGSKVNLNYSRDHTVQDGLDFAVSLCSIPQQQVFIPYCRWYGTRPCSSQRMWAWQYQLPFRKRHQFSQNSDPYLQT